MVHFPAAGIKYVKVEQSNSNPQFYHYLNNNDYSLNHYHKDNISNVMYQKEDGILFKLNIILKITLNLESLSRTRLISQHHCSFSEEESGEHDCFGAKHKKINKFVILIN